MRFVSSAILAASVYAMSSLPAAASLFGFLRPGRGSGGGGSGSTTPTTPAAVPEIDATTAILAVAAIAAALAFAWELRRRRA